MKGTLVSTKRMDYTPIQMNELLAALLATGVAFVVNRWGIRRFGFAEVVWIGPITEEFSKTGIAIISGAMITPVHAIFGIIEAVFDVWTGTSHRYAVAVASVVGHSTFGLLTIWGYTFFASWWAGVSMGILAHVFWNCYVVIFLVKRGQQ